MSRYFTSNSAKLILEGLKGKRTAKLNSVSMRRVTWFLASSIALSCIRIRISSMFWFYLKATLNFSDKGRAHPLLKLIWKECLGTRSFQSGPCKQTCWGVEVEYLDNLGDSQLIAPVIYSNLQAVKTSKYSSWKTFSSGWKLKKTFSESWKVKKRLSYMSQIPMTSSSDLRACSSWVAWENGK